MGTRGPGYRRRGICPRCRHALPARVLLDVHVGAGGAVSRLDEARHRGPERASRGSSGTTSSTSSASANAGGILALLDETADLGSAWSRRPPYARLMACGPRDERRTVSAAAMTAVARQRRAASDTWGRRQSSGVTPQLLVKAAQRASTSLASQGRRTGSGSSMRETRSPRPGSSGCRAAAPAVPVHRTRPRAAGRAAHSPASGRARHPGEHIRALVLGRSSELFRGHVARGAALELPLQPEGVCQPENRAP